MKNLLLLICLSALALSCKKNKQEVPPIVLGAIAGSIEPAGAANMIYAIDERGNQVSVAIDPNTGSFKIEKLIAGNYRLSIPTGTDYNPLSDLSVSVVDGKITETGPIGITLKNPSDPNNKDVRVLSYKINGISTTRYNRPCSYSENILSFSTLSITFGAGVPERIKNTRSEFTLSVAGITGLGQYTLTGSNSIVRLTEVVSSNYSLKTESTSWNIIKDAPAGELEVTAIDRTARTISGTFSATLIKDESGIAKKSVTNGRFFLDY